MANRNRRKRKNKATHLAEAAAGGSTSLTTGGQVSLRIGLTEGDFQIDREAGSLRNVSIITKGQAIGHGFIVDDVMLHQVADAINSHKRGVKVRLTHPDLWFSGADGVEVMLGRVTAEVKVVGDQVRGDIVFGKYAENLPGMGNAKDYLLDLADEDPDKIGLSIVFVENDFEEQTDKETGQPLQPLGRVKDVLAVDFVGDPGANPGGLLANGNSDGQGRTPRKSYGEQIMNEKLKKYLETIGLTAGASDADAIAYWNTRTGNQKEYADSLAAGSGEGDPAPSTDSAVTSPADESAKTPTETEGDEGAKPADEEKPEATDAVSANVAKTALANDQKRRNGITALAKKKGLPADWAQGLCDRGVTLASATELIELAANTGPVPVGAGASVQVGADRNASTLSGGISDAILLRAGTPLMEFDSVTGLAERDGDGKIKTRKPHERASQFRRLSLIDMGKRYLQNIGVPGTEFLGGNQVAELVLNRQRLTDEVGLVALAQGTGDFAYILGDTMRKSLRAAYAEATSTWQLWASRITSPDYKQIKLLSLSEAPDLVERPEGGGVDYGTLSESREVVTLAEFAKAIRITRRAIINDDLGAFNRIPQMMGAAAKRKEDDVVYAILTANAAMADAVALFHATHGNLAAGGDVGALSVTSLAAAFAAMGIQKGIGDESYLDIEPKFLLVPKAIETVARQLIGSLVDPAKSNQTPNPFANRLEVVVSGRLDAADTTDWFLAADPKRVDTVALVFYETEQTPIVKQKTEFDTDDLIISVRHSVAAKAVDHRGMYKNPGA